MDTKSFSSRQVRWAQEIFYYYFQIDYHRDKTNKTANILFPYPKQSTEEEKIFWAKNIKIFYRL